MGKLPVASCVGQAEVALGKLVGQNEGLLLLGE